jgi:type VI protein secretion system component VasF
VKRQTFEQSMRRITETWHKCFYEQERQRRYVETWNMILVCLVVGLVLACYCLWAWR